MPPVLRILWESGPAVVSWGLGLRVLVSILPFAIAKVAQYIITDIAAKIHGTDLPPRFWTLVATEIALNVLVGLITRARRLHPTPSSPTATPSTSASWS